MPRLHLHHPRSILAASRRATARQQRQLGTRGSFTHTEGEVARIFTRVCEEPEGLTPRMNERPCGRAMASTASQLPAPIII